MGYVFEKDMNLKPFNQPVYEKLETKNPKGKNKCSKLSFKSPWIVTKLGNCGFALNDEYAKVTKEGVCFNVEWLKHIQTTHRASAEMQIFHWLYDLYGKNEYVNQDHPNTFLLIKLSASSKGFREFKDKEIFIPTK